MRVLLLFVMLLAGCATNSLKDEGPDSAAGPSK